MPRGERSGVACRCRARRQLRRYGRSLQTGRRERRVFQVELRLCRLPVFPTIGKGGFFIGGAFGKGKVYQQGRYVGDAKITQVSFGFQLGGQAYSEIIFFQAPLDLTRFESGKYALGAQISAVAITAGASASASTGGSGASASGTNRNATTFGRYQDGIAVFTIAKGGLMYEAAVAGQKFSYKARK